MGISGYSCPCFNDSQSLNVPKVNPSFSSDIVEPGDIKIIYDHDIKMRESIESLTKPNSRIQSEVLIPDNSTHDDKKTLRQNS